MKQGSKVCRSFGKPLEFPHSQPHPIAAAIRPQQQDSMRAKRFLQLRPLPKRGGWFRHRGQASSSRFAAGRETFLGIPDNDRAGLPESLSHAIRNHSDGTENGYPHQRSSGFIVDYLIVVVLGDQEHQY